MYEERYVAFIDLLGFSTMVSKPENFQKVYDFFTLLNKKLEQNLHVDGHNHSVETSFFSDTIIVSFPAKLQDPRLPSEIQELINQRRFPSAFVALIEAAEVQTIALEHGFLTRGCLTVGPVYHQHPQIFGPAVVDAYKIETKISHFPRMVISDEVLKKIGSTDPNFFTQNPYVSLDSDWSFYINFLKFYYEKNKKDGILRIIQLTKEKFGSYSKDPHHFQKWKWFIQYLNSYLASEEELKTISPLQIRIQDDSLTLITD